MEQMKYLTVGGVTYAVTDAGKLPLPERAAVGELIRVAAVDEAGQVTATEGFALENGDEVAYG